jgi:DNA-binding protein HU-beta
MASKQDLISAVAAKTELSKKDTEAVISATLAEITSILTKGEKLQLIGFGNFEVRDRAARTGRNPQTGAEIKIAASKVPAFKPGKALKDSVNK